jgi:hypothetical protein
MSSRIHNISEEHRRINNRRPDQAGLVGVLLASGIEGGGAGPETRFHAQRLQTGARVRTEGSARHVRVRF